MENFEKQNTPESQESLKNRLTTLQAEVAKLRALSLEHKENIDVEFDSEHYIDHGYMARAREIEENEIKPILEELQDRDDREAMQHNLPL